MKMVITLQGCFIKESKTSKLDSWIEEHYEDLKLICKKVSKKDNVDDLFHICLEQFINNVKSIQIDPKERKYFFTKLVRNNFYSVSSIYYRTITRYKFNELPDTIEIIDIPYEEDAINIDWVMKQLQEDKKNGMWYFCRLFEIYIEQNCSVTATSKKTLIPINSVSRDLNKPQYQLILYLEILIKSVEN